MSVVLTLLYAPADHPDRLRKALAGPADVVILDLEDAVAPSAKEVARATVPTLIAEWPDRPAQVRVNALGTAWSEPDLAMVAGLPAAVGVRLPKVTSPDQVARAAEIAGPRALHCLLESAAGVEAAAEIARTPQVATIGLGEADLRSDLGTTGEDGLDWCRQRIVVAARAAGLAPPAMAVYANVADLDGLAASCSAGRKMGFLGRAALHPRQLPVIEQAFSPEPDEVDRARAVLQAVNSAAAAGRGTVVLTDGSFLDVAMIQQARRVIEIAERETGR